MSKRCCQATTIIYKSSQELAFESPGPTGGTHTSPQSTTRVEANKTNSTFRYSDANIESHLQDDSMMSEKVEQETGCSGVAKTEEGPGEETATQQRYYLPTASPNCDPQSSQCKAPKKHTMRIPPCMVKIDSPPFDFDLLQDVRIQPPVTVVTLQELDLHSIQNNLNLRIDICHDPELFFQPISGRKGDEKRTEATRYWSALTAEFQIYSHNALSRCRECQKSKSKSQPHVTFEPRLPAFFDNLRDIIQMLVPESDHDEVANHLDTDFLMQQVQAGIMDAVTLSAWLAKLLTSHCAPMRDASAAEVTEQIRSGSETAEMKVFVNGLEKLFSLLESMKLDIANHQIRSFRYPLIEGTVEFQQDCFTKAIQTQQIDISDSQRWYRQQSFCHNFDCGRDKKDEAGQRFACFIHGLVHLCNPSEETLPLTLQYDSNRITRLREDLQDHIQISLCLAVYNDEVQRLAGRHCDPSPMHEDLKRRIICLTEDEAGNGSAISEHLESIGMEISRAAFLMRSPNQKPNLSPTTFDFDRTIRTLREVFREEEQRQPVTIANLESLEERTMHFAEQFSALSTLEISSTQKQWAQARTGKDMILAEWDEMARKLAHIGVVHWRVWRDICYMDPSEHETYNDELDSLPSVIRSMEGEFCAI